MTERKLIVLTDPEGVARHVADWIVQSAIDKKGRFAIALSGGSTPKRLYQMLAEPAYREHMPWTQVHWFWGDERLVPRNDPLSNYRMTWEALLAHVPAPPENIHGVETEGVTAEESARAYEATLKQFYGADTLAADRPLFDINLLGIGPDGHTASLFPRNRRAERAHPLGRAGGRRQGRRPGDHDLSRSGERQPRRLPDGRRGQAPDPGTFPGGGPVPPLRPRRPRRTAFWCSRIRPRRDSRLFGHGTWFRAQVYQSWLEPARPSVSNLNMIGTCRDRPDHFFRPDPQRLDRL